MNRKFALQFLFGITLVVISVWQIYSSQVGLDVINLKSTNPPVTIITPSNAGSSLRPTVLIAHGFAGSSLLMRGFAFTLAHAGYTTISWDFQGHGTNPNSFNLSSQSNDFLLEAESALFKSRSSGLIDSQRVAILGHSMGSGVALTYGMIHPDTSATIAISPVKQSVTPTLPLNLLLMAGSLEPQFVNNAEVLIKLAGGYGGDLTTGTARELVVIPNVEHISILFSPTAHSTARAWLDATFGSQPGASNYTDRRIIWFVLGILGITFLANATINSLPFSSQINVSHKSLWLRLVALFSGGIVATLLLWLLSLLGIKLNQFLGFLVGGYILIWFGIAGVISQLIIRYPITKPTPNELIKGLIAFAALWLGIGMLGNFVWLPWLLIPYRLALWIPGSIILLPWFFSVGEAAKQAKPEGQIGWWVFQTIAIMLSLYMAIQINPELGFIFIILPLVPVMIGLHMLMISSKHGSWAYAMSGAMFTSWLLLAVFPLQ